jgi:DNA repair protein RadC
MILLDTQNNFIDIITIDEGTINETAIFMREVIKEILKADANAIILTHNHPSNSLNFRDEDINTTLKIKKAVQPINVKLLDHILITSNGQAESMANLGKLY